MERIVKKIEGFFIFFLFLNPVLDILSGIYMKLAQEFSLPGITPSLLVRMGVLALFALYILLRRDWKAILTLAPIILAWCLSLAGELMFYYSIDFAADIRYIVQFGYNIAVIFVYTGVFKHSLMTREELLAKINKALLWVPLLFSSYIILSYLFGFGSYTYADRFGFRGFNGYFNSGNDITAVMMMLLPLSFYLIYRMDKYQTSRAGIFAHLATPAATIVALVLIGTKTAFGAAIATLGVMFGYALVKLIWAKDRAYISRFVLVILIALSIFALLFVAKASTFSTIVTSWLAPGLVMEEGREGGAVTAILSGRTNKLKDAMEMWRRTRPYSMAFGVGRGTQAKVIEMDIPEVIFYYGIVGALAMLWLYCKLGFQFLLKLFKSFDLMGLTLMVSLGLAVGYLVLAGHVLFSVTSGFYFAFLLVYAQLYYTSDPMRMKVL